MTGQIVGTLAYLSADRRGGQARDGRRRPVCGRCGRLRGAVRAQAVPAGEPRRLGAGDRRGHAAAAADAAPRRGTGTGRDDRTGDGPRSAVALSQRRGDAGSVVRCAATEFGPAADSSAGRAVAAAGHHGRRGAGRAQSAPQAGCRRGGAVRDRPCRRSGPVRVRVTAVGAQNRPTTSTSLRPADYAVRDTATATAAPAAAQIDQGPSRQEEGSRQRQRRAIDTATCPSAKLTDLRQAVVSARFPIGHPARAEERTSWPLGILCWSQAHTALVGRPVVERLVADGFNVIATAHHAVKPALPAAVDVRSVDLTKPDQVSALVAEVSPSAIVHLAAVIPPLCYANRALARAVNVDATAALVRAAEALPSPPRFVHASSMAVYGSRNPHRFTDLLTPDTSAAGSDLYSCHKILAENIVRTSDLEWSILRLGGVITLEPLVDYGDFDSFYFGAMMPDRQPVHTVDARDVAAAFAAAITTDVVREIFMIAGDDSHKRLHGDVRVRTPRRSDSAAMLFPGRPGDPASDRDWYPLGLDGHRPRTAGAVLSAVLLFRVRTRRSAPGRAGRRGRCVSLAPVLAALMRRQSAVLQAARSLRRPVGQDPAEVGRSRAGRLKPDYASTARGAWDFARTATSPPPMTSAMPRYMNSVGRWFQTIQSINAVKTMTE